MSTADPLYDLLTPHLEAKATQEKTSISNQRPSKSSRNAALSSTESTKYLSRLLSLSLADLQQTEPQSLSQQSHSTLLSIQALSSRSHRSTTASSDRLGTLGASLSTLERAVEELRGTVPALDEAAVGFAENYGRRVGASKSVAEDDTTTTPSSSHVNHVLKARKESMLLARQADRLQDILELPSLLSASIAASASASQNTSTSSASNYTTTLDLHTHIRRLSILYPTSPLIASLQTQAQSALHEMTHDLISSLRAPRIRLPAAIRTIGWLRRVVPQLTSNSDILTLYCGGTGTGTSNLSFNTTARRTSFSTAVETPSSHDEDIFPALFLRARLYAYNAQIDALSPLRDLADQETERRIAGGSAQATAQRRSSSANTVQGHQTERYLKRYIEVFREMSFSAVQMYRNIFTEDHADDEAVSRLPSALASFPMHLVELLMETLKVYLPNVTDSAARESLLMQVLYAANSLGRLGADFSVMIAWLDLPAQNLESTAESEDMSDDKKHEIEPEWARIIKKHRIQAARLDALAANQPK